MFKQERVIIENIAPQIQCGTFFIKRVVGETVTVWADILPDGHDVIQPKYFICTALKRNTGRCACRQRAMTFTAQSSL